MVIIDKLKSLFTVKNFGTVGSYFQEAKSFINLLGFGDLWGGYKYLSDIKAIREGYKSNEDIYAVIDRLISTAASIPICLYEKKSDKWVKIESLNNDFLKLLSKPNPKQTLKDYRKEQYLNYSLTGNLFELKKKATGFGIEQLHILPSQFVEIEMINEDDFFSEVKYYEFCYGTSDIKYFPDEIIHLKNIDPEYPENRKGMSFIQPLKSALSTSNQVHTAEESMIENRGATGMISSNQEGYPLTEEERKEVDENFKDRVGGAKNYNKMITLGSNVKYNKLGSTIKELMLEDIDINKLRKFCNVFGLQSQIFNDPKNKAYNNLTEANKGLYTQAAIPLAQTFVDNWNENLVPIFNEQDKKEYWIELDISKIEVLQKDKKQEAEKNKIVTQSLLSVAAMVSSGQIDRETGINILVFSHGIIKDEAELIIPKPKPIQNE